MSSESDRLFALEGLSILDTPQESLYDDLTRLGAQLFDARIAVITLIDAERAWFKAKVGISRHELPREATLCWVTVLAGELTVAPDTREDERFAKHEMVTGGPKIRFYAGAPLVTEEGHVVGTFCVMDPKPRDPAEVRPEALASLARQAMALMQRNVTERAHDATQRGFEAFFEINLDLLCVAEDGCFVQLNPAWTDVLGWELDDLLSKPFTEFIHPDDVESTIAEAARLATGGKQTVNFENRYRARDGSYRWLAWTAATAPGQTTIYAAARDITEQKRVAQMKNDFVSIVSHELRTPLTSIRGSLRLLQGGVAGKLDGKASELIGIASDNTDRLIRLINDMLDLEKIEAGKMDLELEELDMRDVLQRAADEMQGLADEMGVSVALTLTPVPNVAADPDRLVQLVTNLLSNAIKHSPRGGTVAMSVAHARRRLRVEVRDDGPGISVADRERLFQKFEQVSGSSDIKGGSGLGLAIVKALVHEHGGTIGVESELGRGATFWFELLSLEAVEPLQPSVAPLGKRVLIVEDDRDIARLLSILIAEEGLEAQAVHSVADARQAIATSLPDAVLLDLRLPDGHGIEVLAALRSIPRGSEVPIIVVSASEGRQRSYGNVFLIDWLSKPIDEARLRDAIRHAVGQPRAPLALIADAHEAGRKSTRACLDELGVRTLEASDVDAAIIIARTSRPEILVLDVGLMAAGANRIVDAVRSTGADRPPLVVYTSDGEPNIDRDALTIGDAHYVARGGGDDSYLMSTVRGVLNELFERASTPLP